MSLFIKCTIESFEIKKCNNRRNIEIIAPFKSIFKSFLSLSKKYTINIKNKKTGIIVNLLIPNRNIPNPVKKEGNENTFEFLLRNKPVKTKFIPNTE